MNSTKILLGSGILTWGSEERRTGRYGSITLDDSDYDHTIVIKSEIKQVTISSLVGQRVTLEVRVTIVRKSGHAGDRFLGIFPETPDLGEIITIGTGTLFTDYLSWGCGLAIGLRPQDNRNELWLDPRILYRLHDQSIELYAIPTDKPDHDAPFIPVEKDGAISNGDGTFQIRSKKPLGKTIPIKPKIENLGEGTFIFTAPHGEDNKGEHFEIGE